MNRRNFLQAMLATGMAPAIVRASSLMPGRGIIVPTFSEVLAYGYSPMLDAVELLEQTNSLLADMAIFGCAITRDGVRVPPEQVIELGVMRLPGDGASLY